MKQKLKKIFAGLVVASLVLNQISFIFLFFRNTASAEMEDLYSGVSSIPKYPRRLGTIVAQVSNASQELTELNNQLLEEVKKCDYKNTTSHIERSGIFGGTKPSKPETIGDPCANRDKIEEIRAKIKNKSDELLFLSALLKKEKEHGLEEEINTMTEEEKNVLLKALKNLSPENQLQSPLKKIADKSKENINTTINAPLFSSSISISQEPSPLNSLGGYPSGIPSAKILPTEIGAFATACAIGQQKPIEIIFSIAATLDDLDLGNMRVKLNANLPANIQLKNSIKDIFRNTKIKIPNMRIPIDTALQSRLSPIFIGIGTDMGNFRPEITTPCPSIPTPLEYSCTSSKKQEANYYIDLEWYLESISWLSENCQDVSPINININNEGNNITNKECLIEIKDKNDNTNEIIEKITNSCNSKWTAALSGCIQQSFFNRSTFNLSYYLQNLESLTRRVVANANNCSFFDVLKQVVITPRCLNSPKQKICSDLQGPEYLVRKYIAYKNKCLDVLKITGKINNESEVKNCYLFNNVKNGIYGKCGDQYEKFALFLISKFRDYRNYNDFYNDFSNYQNVKNNAKTALGTLKKECQTIKDSQKQKHLSSSVNPYNLNNKKDCTENGFFWHPPVEGLCKQGIVKSQAIQNPSPSPNQEKISPKTCEEKNTGYCGFVPEPCLYIPLLEKMIGENPSIKKPEKEDYIVKGDECKTQTINDSTLLNLNNNCSLSAGGGINLGTGINTPVIKLPRIEIPDIRLPTFSFMPFFKIKLPSFIFEDLQLPEIRLCSLNNCQLNLPSLNLDIIPPYINLPSLPGFITSVPLTFPEGQINVSFEIGNIDFPQLPFFLYNINLTDFISADIDLDKIALPSPKISVNLEGINVDFSGIDFLLGLFSDLIGFGGGCITGRVIGGLHFIPLVISFPDYYFYWPRFPKIPKMPCDNFCGIIKEELNKVKKNQKKGIYQEANLAKISKKINDAINQKIQQVLNAIRNAYQKTGLEKIKNAIIDYLNNNVYIYEKELVIKGGEIPIPLPDDVIKELDKMPPFLETGFNKPINIIDFNYPILSSPIPLSELNYSKIKKIKVPGLQLTDFNISLDTGVQFRGYTGEEPTGTPYRINFIEINKNVVKETADDIIKNTKEILKVIRY